MSNRGQLWFLARLIIGRAAIGLLTMFLVSALIFSFMSVLPGDTAEMILGQEATPEATASLRTELGLDKPAVERYVAWVANLAHGDFGRSLTSNEDVTSIISRRISNTLFLALFAAVLSVPIGIIVGLLAAMVSGSAIDKSLNYATLAMISVPEFLVSYLLILIVSVNLELLPSMSDLGARAGFEERLLKTLLPALCLSVPIFAYILRMTRAAILNVLGSSYLEMAELKGLTRWRQIYHHALPNAVSPIATVVAICLAHLVVGVVVIEVIFVYPGIGQLLVDSVTRRDFPVVQVCGLFFALIYVVFNLLADLISTIANPRILHARS